jgi:hypothetical protein
MTYVIKGECFHTKLCLTPKRQINHMRSRFFGSFNQVVQAWTGGARTHQGWAPGSTKYVVKANTVKSMCS